MAESPDVWIVTGRRTPFGRERGALRDCPAWSLGASAIAAVLAASGLDRVDRVVLGNVTNGGNVARTAALASGLPVTTPAMTVNNQCASGLTAVRLAAEAIRAGSAECVVAGGAESVSQSIVRLGTESRRSDTDSRARPSITHAPPPFDDHGLGAIADAVAARLGIGREVQDACAIESRRRVLAGRDEGFFADALVQPPATARNAGTDDELVGRSLSAALLARLQPAFAVGGTVTAGNTAPLADGAAALLLASGEAVRDHRWRPLARVVALADAAGDPAETPVAAVTAAERALGAARLGADAIARWDVNEAFAAKVIAFQRAFELAPGTLNATGGALAYGHPFAASGATSLLHLILDLRRRGGGLGLAAIAGAGGAGEAAIIEVPGDA